MSPPDRAGKPRGVPATAIIVERTNIHRVLEALDFSPDNARRPEENLINCLLQQKLRFQHVDKHGYLVFRASADAAIDSSVLARLSPLFADGSRFLHHHAGGTRTVTVKGGRLIEGDAASQPHGKGRTRRELFLGVRARIDAARPKDFVTTGFEALTHLWTIDDRQWMLNRRSMWNVIETNLTKLNYSTEHREQFCRYFLSGVQSAASELTPLDQFLGTPLQSADEASFVFTLFDENRNQQSLLLRSALWSIAHLYDGSPQAAAMIRYFVDGVLGGSWRDLFALKGGRETKISQPPDAWLADWCEQAMRFIAGPSPSYWAGYGYFADTVDYAFSIAEHLCDQNRPLPPILARLEAMVERVEQVTAQSDSQRELVEKLQLQFNRTDLPRAARRLFRATRYRPLTKYASIEDQLDALRNCGFALAHPYAARDLLVDFERYDLESRPYGGILIALGQRASTSPNTPLCHSLWVSGETSYSPGVYVRTLERLELMTARVLSLSNASERMGETSMQLSFLRRDEKTLIELPSKDVRTNVNKIIARYDALLAGEGAKVRLYLNRYQYGHWLLFAAMSSAQFDALQRLSEIEFVALSAL